MRHSVDAKAARLTTPHLESPACELSDILKKLSQPDIEKVMKVSPALAQKTKKLLQQWTSQPDMQMSAADSFLGDVYSGLRYRELSTAAKQRADERLRILSGLYGLLRPRDGIYPYRLEMGYRLPTLPRGSLYDYWGDSIAKLINSNLVVNLAPVEYSKAVLPHLGEATEVTSPKFVTYSQKANKPISVAVHAKIARGAFARWLLENDIQDIEQFNEFELLGYRYDPGLSELQQPTFVCREFTGTGLSIKS